MTSRVDEARLVARELLEALENSSASIDAILLKAKRLARLMRDADAQTWLDYETRGYPDEFSFSDLGTCRKYAVAGGRLNLQSSKYYPASLPHLEANAESDEALLNSLRTSRPSTTKAKDFLEKSATEALMGTQIEIQQSQRKAYAHSKSIFSSMKSAIHGFATDAYLAIELGDAAEDIFEGARKEVDLFVRSNCPKAAEKIVAINERMAEGSAESLSAALTSCRRLLMDVADAIFPARDEWTDSAGKPRAVGTENYKNRILAFLDESGSSRGSTEILDSGLEHLAARLDAVYEKTCKGVHVDVTLQEARLAVIHTYLFIGEIASSAGASAGDG